MSQKAFVDHDDKLENGSQLPDLGMMVANPRFELGTNGL